MGQWAGIMAGGSRDSTLLPCPPWGSPSGVSGLGFPVQALAISSSGRYLGGLFGLHPSTFKRALPPQLSSQLMGWKNSIISRQAKSSRDSGPCIVQKPRAFACGSCKELRVCGLRELFLMCNLASFSHLASLLTEGPNGNRQGTFVKRRNVTVIRS